VVLRALLAHRLLFWALLVPRLLYRPTSSPARHPLFWSALVAARGLVSLTLLPPSVKSVKHSAFMFGDLSSRATHEQSAEATRAEEANTSATARSHAQRAHPAGVITSSAGASSAPTRAAGLPDGLRRSDRSSSKPILRISPSLYLTCPFSRAVSFALQFTVPVRSRDHLRCTGTCAPAHGQGAHPVGVCRSDVVGNRAVLALIVPVRCSPHAAAQQRVPTLLLGRCGSCGHGGSVASWHDLAPRPREAPHFTQPLRRHDGAPGCARSKGSAPASFACPAMQSPASSPARNWEKKSFVFIL